MLRRLFGILWGPPPAPPPRLRDLLERLDALEGDVSGLRKRVKSVEGQLSGGKRREEGPQEPPGPTNPDQLDIPIPPRAVPPTAELARRFKLGG